MSATRDPDAIVATWLEEGPNRLPDATRRAIAVGTRTTDQRRRGPAVLWRSLGMHPIARTGLAVVAVVLAIGGAVLVLNPRQSAGGPAASSASPRSTSPSPAPSAGAATSSAPSGAPASPISFTSSRYGYTVRYPSDYLAETASTDWPVGGQALPTSTYLDRFTYAGPFNGPTVFVGIASQAIPAGMDPATWLADRQTADASALVAGCSEAEGWQRTVVGEVRAWRFDAVCDTYPGSEIVFEVNGHGWIISGDRAAVDAMLPSLILP